MQVAVTGRTAEQVEHVAEEIHGRALVGDVSKRDDVERWAAEVGDVQEIFYRSRHPYTLGLLDSVPSVDVRSDPPGASISPATAGAPVRASFSKRRSSCGSER